MLAFSCEQRERDKLDACLFASLRVDDVQTHARRRSYWAPVLVAESAHAGANRLLTDLEMVAIASRSRGHIGQGRGLVMVGVLGVGVRGGLHVVGMLVAWLIYGLDRLYGMGVFHAEMGRVMGWARRLVRLMGRVDGRGKRRGVRGITVGRRCVTGMAAMARMV